MNKKNPFNQLESHFCQFTFTPFHLAASPLPESIWIPAGFGMGRKREEQKIIKMKMEAAKKDKQSERD